MKHVRTWIAITTIATLLTITATPTSAQQSTPRPPNWVVKAVKEGKRCRKYEPLFRAYKLPVIQMTYLAWRESRCRPGAVNAIWKNGKIVWTLNSDGSFDSGLLQINSSWKTVTSQVCRAPFGKLDVLLDPVCNVKVAAYLYERGGLRHWGMSS